jgi:molecular chaperone Hsp33
MSDRLLPFMFDAADVRGAVVNLDAAWREVLTRHAYPAAVQGLLGEAMAAAALLSSTLKFDGSMVLQTQSADESAPVRLLVVECGADLGMRATAKLGGPMPPGDRPAMAGLVGDGKLVITLDPKDGQAAYQGVVPLEGTCLGGALENYMLRSEQLETRIVLAADGKRACGLLVQKMPGSGGRAVATSRWDEASVLARTLSAQELLTLEPREILRRLFHEFDLRLFDERGPQFRCTCSRDRVADMLRMLGRSEVEDIVAEQGRVAVDCEFCSQNYAFDAAQAAALFGAEGAGTTMLRH